MVTSLDTRTVRILTQGRLSETSASGKVTVVKAGPDWTRLEVNVLDDECYASAGSANRHIYF
jgi:hypothetical protein